MTLEEALTVLSERDAENAQLKAMVTEAAPEMLKKYSEARSRALSAGNPAEAKQLHQRAERWRAILGQAWGIT